MTDGHMLHEKAPAIDYGRWKACKTHLTFGGYYHVPIADLRDDKHCLDWMIHLAEKGEAYDFNQFVLLVEEVVGLRFATRKPQVRLNSGS